MFVYPKFVIPQINVLQVFFIKFCENTRRVKQEFQTSFRLSQRVPKLSVLANLILKKFGENSKENILKIGIVPE